MQDERLKKMEDIELVGLYKQTRENSYYGEIVERYMHLVYGLCYKYFENRDESRDAAMEIFEIMMHDIPKFEIRSLKNWMCIVSRNHCLKKLGKSRATARKNVLYGKQQDRYVEFSPETTLGEKEFKDLSLEKLPDAMESLNNDQKKCVELFYLQDKSYHEVADITGFSIKQVKSYIQNGKRNLKIYLTTKHG